MHITSDNIEEIAKYFSLMKDMYKVNQLRYYQLYADDIKNEKYNMKSLPILWDKKNIKIDSLQNLIQKFGQISNDRYEHFIEEQLTKEHWKGHLIPRYYKFIKNGSYYPDDENIFIDIIRNTRHETNEVFWACCRLSSLIKTDDISMKAFAKSLEMSCDTLSLLDLEKYNKIFNNKFKSIPTELIESEEYKYIKGNLNKISETNTKPLFTETNLITKRISIDVDNISQSNKLNLTKAKDQVNYILNRIKNYIDDDILTKEYLSIHNCRDGRLNLKPTQAEFEVQYNDSTKSALIFSIVSNILSHSFKIGSNPQQLLGYDELLYKSDVSSYFKPFFDSAILKDQLDNLPNKIVSDGTTKKTKSNKI